MGFQLGSIREKYNGVDYSISTATGGSIPDGTSGFLWISGWNRTGRNLLSDTIPFTVTAPNNKINITLNASIRKNGEDLFKIVVSYYPTNSPTLAKQILRWDAKDNDQETLISLPVTLEITTDEQLDITSSPDFASLPSGRNKGQILYAIAEDSYYEFDGSLWQETNFNGLNYIASTTLLGGADYSLNSLPNIYTLSTPEKGSNTDSTKVNYWLLNGLLEGAGQILDSSYALKLLVFVGGVDKSASFSEKVKVNIKGYTRRSTGEYQSGITTSTFTWSYGVPFYLPQDLQRGYACSIDIWLSFDENELTASLIDGESVMVKIDKFTSLGTPSNFSAFLGNGIFSEGNKLRIVPNVRLDGVGSWQGFDVHQNVNQPVVGLLNNTPNQIIAIDSPSNGGVIVRQNSGDLKGTEVIRAIVSTELGESDPSPVSNTVTLNGTQSLSIQVTHPVSASLWQVRDDYPDVVASFAECPNGPLKMKVYLDIDGTLYDYGTLINVGGSTTQTFTISDISGASVIGSLPTIPVDYSLFKQTTAPVLSSIAGSLSAGDYAVYVAYVYEATDGIITKVSHSTGLGCVPEITESVYDTISQVENILNIKVAVAFTQPAVDATVTVTVNAIAYLIPEAYIQIANGGFYQIQSINASLNEIVVKNLGGDNETPGTIIPINSAIAPAGKIGADGPPGTEIDFPALTEETTLDNTSDFLVFYDTSATESKKILIENVATEVDFDAIAEETTLDSTSDFLVYYDASATENKKILVENVATGVDFDTIAEETTIDQSADYLVFRDTSATEDKKILPINLGFSGTVTSAQPYGANNIRLTFENELKADITATLSHPSDIYIVFEETIGATTSSNLGTNGSTITCSNAAVIDDTQSFEGLTSLKCLADNDYATLTMTTGLDLTREYELKLVFYPTTNDTSGGEIHSFISTHTAGFANGFYFGYLTNTCLFRILDAGGSVAFGHDFGQGYFSLNNWHTIILTRTETAPSVFTMKLIADDVVVKDSANANTQPTTTTNLTLGNNIGDLTSYGARGYVDSFTFKYTDV